MTRASVSNAGIVRAAMQRVCGYILPRSIERPLSLLLQGVSHRFIERGSRIIEAERSGSEAFIVTGGAARVSGTEIFCRAPSLLGEMALIGGIGKRTVDVLAETDTSLLVLPEDVFVKAFMGFPPVSMALRRLVERRIEEAMGRTAVKDPGQILDSVPAEKRTINIPCTIVRGIGSFRAEKIRSMLTEGIRPSPTPFSFLYMCPGDGDPIYLSMVSPLGYLKTSTATYPFGANPYNFDVSFFINYLYSLEHHRDFKMVNSGECLDILFRHTGSELEQFLYGLYERQRNPWLRDHTSYDEVRVYSPIPVADEGGINSLGGFIVSDSKAGKAILEIMAQTGVFYPIYDTQGELLF